ncbi:hypothetical protein EDC52_102454 [Biostraticola tofi]|uniref:Uncharacterized protein n=1 Tax=Biostraticola tofi TaxID=466109 RepID=A0A4R3Z280_9GAMM|nr:hypothetical protein EDC52_102454 [Biostraticola tofi]
MLFHGSQATAVKSCDAGPVGPATALDSVAFQLLMQFLHRNHLGGCIGG